MNVGAQAPPEAAVLTAIERLLQSYHPGEEALANIRRKHPDPRDQLQVLLLAQGIDEKMSSPASQGSTRQ